MKILFVAMANSVHTARWINQMSDTKWDLQLFPSLNSDAIHEGLERIVVYETFYGPQPQLKNKAKILGIPFFSQPLANLVRDVIQRYFPSLRTIYLELIIRWWKPDIVHAMEIQGAGYLTLAVKERMGKNFPPWIMSIWGSDIYLFGRLNRHREKIKRVLSNVDYLLCESQRDVQLAKQFGFKNKVLPILPMGGGITDFQSGLIKFKKPSERKTILIKGNQNWAGRALVALRSVERCAHFLIQKKIEVVIYSVKKGSEIEIAAEVIQQKTGLPITLLPPGQSREDILALQGNARVFIGLSYSDGVPQSLLESMLMGSFPIQSNTAALSGLIRNGKNGFIVHPEEPSEVEKSLVKALTHDKLINNAAKYNQSFIVKNLNYLKIKEKTINMYQQIQTKMDRRE